MKIRNLLENNNATEDSKLLKMILDFQNMLIDCDVIEGVELSAKKFSEINNHHTFYKFHLTHEFIDMKFKLHSESCLYYDIESQRFEMMCVNPTAKILYKNIIPWIISQKICIEIEKFRGNYKFLANWEESPGIVEYPLEIEVRYNNDTQDEALRLLWSVKDQGWKAIDNQDGVDGMIFTTIDSILKYLRTYE